MRLLPEMAELVIEALRFYARTRAPEPQLFKVERWDWQDTHVGEVVAIASLILIGKAAFRAAAEQFPGAGLTLVIVRSGARVIDKQEPSGATLRPSPATDPPSHPAQRSSAPPRQARSARSQSLRASSE